AYADDAGSTTPPPAASATAPASLDNTAPPTAPPTIADADDTAPTTAPPPTSPPISAPPTAAAATSVVSLDDIGDQGIGVDIGAAAGGRVTPGGLRVSGHYLYQLSDQDWFDGTATFTFGSGTAACFRDRDNAFICEHGLADGDGFEVAAT